MDNQIKEFVDVRKLKAGIAIVLEQLKAFDKMGIKTLSERDIESLRNEIFASIEYAKVN